MKRNGMKVLGVFLAMNCVGFAVAMFLSVNLGSDSIGLLCDGIHVFFHLQYGNASVLYNLLIIGIALCCARKNLGMGSIAYALISGYFIDFYCFLLEPLQLSQALLSIRLLGLVLGQLSLAFALAMLIQLDLGMNALDAVLHKVVKVTGWNYTVLRTMIDVAYALMGSLLGGVFGIGTIFSVLTMGSCIGMFTKLIEKIGNHQRESMVKA